MSDHDRGQEPDTDAWLADVPPELEPPPELRGQVLDALRERRLVRRGRPERSRLRHWALTAAAALVAFLGGRMSASRAPAPTGGSEAVTSGPVVALEGMPGLEIPPGSSAWALLLYEDGRFDAGDRSPEEVARAYDAWGAAAAAAGVMLLGEKFADEETLLVEGSAETGPLGFAEAPGVLGGMFVVAAPTRQDALALARETPHHEMGGVILMREIDRLPR